MSQDRSRTVPAVHGREAAAADPRHEVELAAALRERHDREELVQLVGRFTAGEGSFDAMMRRVIWRALARGFGDGVRVGRGVLCHHLETFTIGAGVFIGDQVVPNSVPGAPLSGTEPMIRVYGLDTITATTQDAAGIRGAVRFIAGDHGSLLSPAASLPATQEMQRQAASFIATNGTTVVVTDSSVIQQ